MLEITRRTHFSTPVVYRRTILVSFLALILLLFVSFLISLFFSSLFICFIFFLYFCLFILRLGFCFLLLCCLGLCEPNRATRNRVFFLLLYSPFRIGAASGGVAANQRNRKARLKTRPKGEPSPKISVTRSGSFGRDILIDRSLLPHNQPTSQSGVVPGELDSKKIRKKKEE